MSHLGSRLTLVTLWLLHWLPLPWLATVGRGFGWLLYVAGHERRGVALTNLGLCFPQLTTAQKSALARRHFMAVGRSFLERGLLWWATPTRLQRLLTLEGLHHLPTDRPVILLAPHFVGLDAGWTCLTLQRDLVSMYAHQKNPLFDAALYRGRQRFGCQQLVSRQEGTRRLVKALHAGRPLYYLPDMDYGRRDALFVPFFGVPAATVTGLARLARLTGAAVLTVTTRQTDSGYVTRLGAAWTDFPGDDLAADTRRMNAAIEAEILAMPEQYYWLHKRFKTRPAGEKRPY